jgi:peptidyl-prolyl cis-trans isomerase NIMA-interacting 1
MKPIVLAIGLAFLCSGAQACSKRAGGPASHGSGAGSSAPAETDQLGFRYPAARWRLANIDQLDRATLWLGHIAIRHDHSQVDLFRPPGWRPDSPNPARSVAQAFALAEKLRAQIAASPDDFERLARAHSDDVVSKDDGMLGGVRASQLASIDFLDVLAALKAGEVSQPFQTPYGFHIVKRYPPPADERVAGERIVVGYQGVFGLVSESHRTRAEALQLAREIADRAKKDPASFGVLVGRHSENVDRASGGDMGVYSTRDPGHVPVEIHRLASIGVGEVTGPIDSRFGFEILKRVAAVPRADYAMTAIELTAAGDSPDPDAARAEALKLAEEVLRVLKVAPDRFGEFQRRYCCDRLRRWTSGRGDVELGRALDRLSFGQIVDKPILQGGGYLLMKRLDPSTLAPEPPRQWEVPSPSDPDYDAIARNTDGPRLAAAARSFMRAARESSVLSPEAVQTTTKAIDHFAAYLEQNQVDQVTVHSTTLSALGSLATDLGPEQFGRLEAFGRRWIIRQMMPPGSVD